MDAEAFGIDLGGTPVQSKRPGLSPGLSLFRTLRRSGRGRPLLHSLPLCLEHVPEELVVDLVVVLHFGSLNESSQQARTTIRRGLLEVGVAALDVFTEKLRGPVGFAKVLEGIVDVVGQVAGSLPQILDLGGLAM